jgi:type IV pilus assembly protein PilC
MFKRVESPLIPGRGRTGSGNSSSIRPAVRRSSGANNQRSPSAVPVMGKNQVASGIAWPEKKVRSSDLVVALSQLTIMIQSGDDLAEALRMIARQCSQPKLRKVLSDIHREVEQGNRFSAALGKYPKVFDEAMVAAVEAGEQSGRLTEVLDRMVGAMRKDQHLRSVVGSMLTYPAVLCLITTVVVFAMFFFVLPQFAKVFADMERPIPPLTQFLLGIGGFLRQRIGWLAAAATAALGLGVALRGNPRLRASLDRLVLHAAVVKQASRPLMAGRLFRLMGTMVENGVPLLDTIRLCKKATSNSLFRDLFGTIEHDILRGEGMARALSQATFLPEGAAHMVSTGERTARLPFVLQSLGDYFEEEGERKLRWMVKLLEPAMIIGLGAVVATVVLSIVLPMLDMTAVS